MFGGVLASAAAALLSAASHRQEQLVAGTTSRNTSSTSAVCQGGCGACVNCASPEQTGCNCAALASCGFGPSECAAGQLYDCMAGQCVAAAAAAAAGHQRTAAPALEEAWAGYLRRPAVQHALTATAERVRQDPEWAKQYQAVTRALDQTRARQPAPPTPLAGVEAR